MDPANRNIQINCETSDEFWEEQDGYDMVRIQLSFNDVCFRFSSCQMFHKTLAWGSQG